MSVRQDHPAAHPWAAGKLRAALRRAQRLYDAHLRWPIPVWRLRGHAELAVENLPVKIAAPDYTLLARTRRKELEPGISGILRALLRPGDTFFDIGAHIGYYTPLASRRVEEHGSIHAFEPDPIARGFLERNVQLNGLTNVIVAPVAVADCNGIVMLAAQRFEEANSSIGQMPERLLFKRQTELASVSLDSYCTERGLCPGVLKVDVEGAEGLVLAGGRQAFERAHAALVEFHPTKMRRDFHASPQEFLRALCALNKRVYRVDVDGSGVRLSRVLADQPLKANAHLVAMDQETETQCGLDLIDPVVVGGVGAGSGATH